jgi:hypothetical protein
MVYSTWHMQHLKNALEKRLNLRQQKSLVQTTSDYQPEEYITHQDNISYEDDSLLNR